MQERALMICAPTAVMSHHSFGCFRTSTSAFTLDHLDLLLSDNCNVFAIKLTTSDAGRLKISTIIVILCRGSSSIVPENNGPALLFVFFAVGVIYTWRGFTRSLSVPSWSLPGFRLVSLPIWSPVLDDFTILAALRLYFDSFSLQSP